MLTAFSLAEAMELAEVGQPSVVTIGNFDGVHLGHQSVIRRLCERARVLGARSVVVTFDPHPARVLGKGGVLPQTQLLTPLPEKLELLAATGVDLTLVLPFSEDLRTLSAYDFADKILHRGLGAVEVHEGESFRFGRNAEGDMGQLERLGRELGFQVVLNSAFLLRGAPVSSSRIRSLVSLGEMSQARALLGRPFFLDSTPERGRGYGTRYAVPTINLKTPAELLPAHGVYATVLEVGRDGQRQVFQGVTNAGNRPTFGADSYAIETHLFDFHPIVLEETTPLRLHFLYRLREERRFASPEDLKAQIGKDVQRAQRLFTLQTRLCSA